MYKAKATIVVLIFCIFVTSENAQARKFFIGGHGGFSMYSLKDLNEEIDSINTEAGGDYLESISHGLEYGLQFGLKLNQAASVAIGYSRLNGKTDFSDASGSLEYDVPADVFELHFTHFAPSEKNIQFGFGGNLGLIRSAGSINLSITGESPIKGDFSGSGFLFAGFGALDWNVSPSFSVFGNLGYRYATIDGLEVNNIEIRTEDGDNYQLDYNGVFLRIGLLIRPEKF